ENRGIKNVLVFINHYMTSAGAIIGHKAFNSFPAYSEGFGGTDVSCKTLHLEDLGKSILLTTNVYLNFREEIRWVIEAFDEKLKTGELKIMEPEEYYRKLAGRNADSGS
ncbi:MAG TPA: hypothetical protein VK308_00030, partial [Pyrinomonadaceae bacterium]|nr:hypothetical protein [Pyrinomonadaceae bacterium]